jgi:mannitol-1-phosphate/altronate dehydrogenase
MNFRKNCTIKIPGFIKRTGLMFMASGLIFACNDGNKKAEESEIEIDQIEVEEDTMSNYSYESNAVANYLTYVDGEDEYEKMQEEMDPEKALQKFAAAVSERSREFGMQADEKLEVIGDSLSDSRENMNVHLQTAIAAFEKLQENSYEELSDEVDELKAELQEIDMQANDAKEKLRTFFNNAANVMEEMDAPTSDGTMSANPGAADSQ